MLQDVLVRVLESLPQFRRESRFKSWLFGIATHVCLDHLRQKKRWRVEAQMLGERETTETPEFSEGLRVLVSRPEFRFEIREHIAFCFACIARTLPPEEQAALLLREMLEFTAEEAAAILNVSEPVFRHRLAAARAAMTHAYDGLCQLINKTGACWQCRGLRELTPEQNRGADLVQIERCARHGHHSRKSSRCPLPHCPRSRLGKRPLAPHARPVLPKSRQSRRKPPVVRYASGRHFERSEKSPYHRSAR